MKPPVVGKAHNPRCFGGKDSSELGFDYVGNKKAWMNRLMFFQWLYQFDSYIARTPIMRAVLVLDNCSVHGDIETLPELHHVYVIFWPKNTTARLQPLDAGIIASVKRRFSNIKVQKAVDRIDIRKTKNIYDCNVRMAIEFIYSIWNNLPAHIITKCWLKTGLSED